MNSTPQAKVTITAGGVVLNPQGMVLVVSQRGGIWSLPKGHVDPGEEPLQAAQREIMEESGVSQTTLIQTLGTYGRYKIAKDGGDDKSEWKIMFFFLFHTKIMALQPQDPCNPEARWVNPDEVANLLTHPKDKAFYQSIRQQLK